MHDGEIAKINILLSRINENVDRLVACSRFLSDNQERRADAVARFHLKNLIGSSLFRRISF